MPDLSFKGGYKPSKNYATVAAELEDRGARPSPNGDVETIIARHLDKLIGPPLRLSHTFATGGTETFAHGAGTQPYRVDLAGFENSMAVRVIGWDDKNVTVSADKNAVVHLAIYAP